MTAPDERPLILDALARAGGSPTLAAPLLGWSLMTLRRRLDALWTLEERRRLQACGVLARRGAAGGRGAARAAAERRVARAVSAGEAVRG